MSYLLPHLHSGWAVDQAILAEEERLVITRFGHDWDETCMQVPSNLLTLDSNIYPSLICGCVILLRMFFLFYFGGLGVRRRWGRCGLCGY